MNVVSVETVLINHMGSRLIIHKWNADYSVAANLEHFLCRFLTITTHSNHGMSDIKHKKYMFAIFLVNTFTSVPMSYLSYFYKCRGFASTLRAKFVSIYVISNLHIEFFHSGWLNHTFSVYLKHHYESFAFSVSVLYSSILSSSKLLQLIDPKDLSPPPILILPTFSLIRNQSEMTGRTGRNNIMSDFKDPAS